uniref:Uncharacterized protein n=1 Tax=Arundo donax TaxID=35708 RepID=A0A0A8YZ96_ARUDO
MILSVFSQLCAIGLNQSTPLIGLKHPA